MKVISCRKGSKKEDGRSLRGPLRAVPCRALGWPPFVSTLNQRLRQEAQQPKGTEFGHEILSYGHAHHVSEASAGNAEVGLQVLHKAARGLGLVDVVSEKAT